WFSHWDMNLIVDLRIVAGTKLPIWSRVQNLPIKLFRCDTNRSVSLRHGHADFFPLRLTQQSQPDEDGGWNDRPQNLNSGISVCVYRSSTFPGAVAEEKPEHDTGYSKKDHSREGVNEMEERVDPRTVRGDILW